MNIANQLIIYSGVIFFMNKIDIYIKLLRHSFSKNRRNKAKIILKEWILTRPFLRKSNGKFDKDFSSESNVDSWSFKESRKIDIDYVKQSHVGMVEDSIEGDGFAHTNINYQIQKLYDASSYTNGSTHRSVFARSGERMTLYSASRLWPGMSVPSKQWLPVNRTVKGVTANLFGNVASGDGNYFHWLVDSLSRIFIIERFYPLDSIDCVLVPPLKYDFHWDSLIALGFEKSQIIEMSPLDCMKFECLVVSSPPRGRNSAIAPGWMIDRFNETIGVKAEQVKSTAGKQVFISRRDAPKRMFENEKEICEFFRNRGFDVVELASLTLYEKIAVFRDAEVIVSQTGAGLTNLMFCQPNVKVLEIVDRNFVHPILASMVNYKRGTHQVHYFNSKSAGGHGGAAIARSTLDIPALAKALDKIE